jgi:hypothetical protein
MLQVLLNKLLQTELLEECYVTYHVTEAGRTLKVAQSVLLLTVTDYFDM